jgi:hypothetical protein
MEKSNERLNEKPALSRDEIRTGLTDRQRKELWYWDNSTEKRISLKTRVIALIGVAIVALGLWMFFGEPPEGVYLGRAFGRAFGFKHIFFFCVLTLLLIYVLTKIVGYFMDDD